MTRATPAVRGRHLPALDGVRALAILAVFAYHLGAGWLPGGYLGVDLFFVLSGFLITSLIAEEWIERGSLSFGGFWGRRARRLLPGLLLMLVVLGAWLALAGPGPLVNLHAVRDDAIATVLYVANWHQLFAHQSYFAQFGAPSPLQHTWSLGIEEQFYVVWPLAVIGAFRLARTRWRAAGLALAAGGAAASAAWMAWLAGQGASANRLYYGTDTRASDLLVGATLALLVAGRGQPSAAARKRLAVAGPAALAVLAAFAWRAASVATSSGPAPASSGAPGRSMFEWGFFACALAAAVVLADVRQEQLSPLGRVLALPPLTFIGRISYELYLWHWPVICELTPERLGVSGAPCQLIRISVTFALSAASFFFIDQPIRRWAFGGWRPQLKIAVAPVGMAVAVLAMTLGTSQTVAAAGTSRVSTKGAGGTIVGITTTTDPKGSSTSITTTTEPLVPTPTKAHPLQIIMLGDSVMGDVAAASVAALDSTRVVDVKDGHFDGWGFTSDAGWRSDVPAQIESDHASVVIAMWSWDDDFLLAHPAAFRTELTQYVHLVLGLPGVKQLIFLQFPEEGPPQFGPGGGEASRNRGVDAWNADVRSMTTLEPGKVLYLPIASSVERDGRFEAWLPPNDRWSLPSADWVRVRSVDGVHFCPAGAARYAAALTADLTELYHLPPTSSDWSTGLWNLESQWEADDDSCPNDHP